MIIRQHAHFLAADANHNRDGTFWVKGAGITEVNAPNWPALAQMVLVTRLELDVEAAAGLHHMYVRIWHDDTGDLVSWRQPVAVKVVDVNRPIFINVIGHVNFQVPKAGMIGIETAIDEIRLPILRILANTVPGSGRVMGIPAPLPPFRPHGTGKRRRR